MNLRSHNGRVVLDVEGRAQVVHLHGQGAVACLAHPGGPGAGWGYLRSPQLEQQLLMIYLEPVGTGDSARLTGLSAYSIARYVSQAVAVLESLGEPALLLGHSHGGFVAQQLAIERPDLLRGLVLYDTSPTTGPEFWSAVSAAVEAFATRHAGHPQLSEVLQALEDEGRATDDQAATANFRRHLPIYFADYWAREPEFRVLRETATMHHLPPEHTASEPFEMRPRLKEIAVPTLTVVGRHDPICTPYWSKVLHQGIPAADLVMLEDSGHFGHLEQPTAFAHAVVKFAERVCKGAPT
jgi:pimeloyl-ACP methyl ester carboxylesterase